MVVVKDVVVVDVDGMDNIEFSMEDIEYVEGNMDHPIEEVGVYMDEKEERNSEEDKTMNMEENMDHSMGDDMDEKTRYMVEIWGR